MEKYRLFFKKHWWKILLGLAIVFFSTPIITNIIVPKVQSLKYPACPENLSGILTEPIINPNDLDFIIPLGNLSPPGHTLPTNHVYFIVKDDETNFVRGRPIYTPGDAIITTIGDETQRYTGELAKMRGVENRFDHSIGIQVCRGMNIVISGLTTLSDEIEKVKETGKKKCNNYEDKRLADSKGITSKEDCEHKLNYKVKAGELLGYARSFEIGTFNKNKLLDFINPSRYSFGDQMGNNLNGMCVFDLYFGSLKESYYNLLGDLNIDKKFRTIEPRCGELMQDKAGTLQGNWFHPDNKYGEEYDGRLVSLVHQNFDPTFGAISPGYAFMTDPIDANHALTFFPTHSGTYNREFSEITPGTSIYCYDENNNGLGWGNYPFKFLIQLIDTTHIKIEKQKGACGENETFSSPYFYER